MKREDAKTRRREDEGENLHRDNAAEMVMRLFRFCLIKTIHFFSFFFASSRLRV